MVGGRNCRAGNVQPDVKDLLGFAKELTMNPLGRIERVSFVF